MRTLLFTEQLLREGDTIVAYCPELDVSSCGADEAEARANLRTALRLFLEEAARMGTLADILTEALSSVTTCARLT
jgi:predicted RNase H-like HicB family nuclease